MLSEAKLSYVYSIRCDLREIIKGILAPARLVPSSCVSAPRNTREAGISSSDIDILGLSFEVTQLVFTISTHKS